MSQASVNLKSTWSTSAGETPIAGTSVVACDSISTLDLLVLGGTKIQAAAFPITKSLVQAFYIDSSQPITLYLNGTNEVQTVTITGSPTGGTFTLTYSGQTTGTIAYNASASTVQTALEALSNIGVGDVAVTGSAGGPYTVAFKGDLGLQNVSAMTASGAGLTGGSSPSVSIATATAGVAPDDTWECAASDPHQWRIDGLFANPMTTDVVNVHITNAGTASARVRLRFGVNAA